MKINKVDIDIKSAGLLLFLADHADSKGTVKLGVREMSRQIGESPMWVSRHIEELSNAKLVYTMPLQKSVTENINPRKIIKCCLTASYGKIAENGMVQNTDTERFDKIWASYHRDGDKGSKKSAFRNYLNLSQQDKDSLEKDLPYYMAFTKPQFRVMMPRLIKEKIWKNPKEVNGILIPMDNYRIANVEAFKKWFNEEVEGTDIPKVTTVTTDRQVNLNLCYTLYPHLMSNAMKIVKENGYYLNMAKIGKLTFDYIFDPARLIEICEKGGGE